MSEDKHNPNFIIICPKCNNKNCVVNVEGEPINIHLESGTESGTETGIKLHVQYTCNDCGYTRSFTC